MAIVFSQTRRCTRQFWALKAYIQLIRWRNTRKANVLQPFQNRACRTRNRINNRIYGLRKMSEYKDREFKTMFRMTRTSFMAMEIAIKPHLNYFFQVTITLSAMKHLLILFSSWFHGVGKIYIGKLKLLLLLLLLLLSY